MFTSLSIAAGGLAGITMFPALAADTSYTQVSIEKVSDGTGHDDNSTQCFINEENGYTIGDDTPTDGVVCVNDQVTYKVGASFDAGPERDVNIRITGFSGLSQSNLFCYDTEIATATGTDANCTFHVKRGAVGSIDRELIVTPTNIATDVRAKVAITGGTTATAAPVTVVGSPMMDLVLRQSGTNTFGQNTNGQGTFSIMTRTLSPEGWAEIKGSLNSGLNWKVDDIEGFPEGTTFQTTAGGPLLGSTFSQSQVGVTVQLPEGTYPSNDNPEPNLKTYYPKLIVNDDSFSKIVNGVKLLNNGDGSEPGGNSDCNVSSSNFGFGATTGDYSPNNNCGVMNFTFKPDGIYNKSMYAPNDWNHDVTHENNRFFEKTEWTRGGIVAPRVASDTELKATMSINTDEFTQNNSNPVVICDTWNDPRVFFDSSRDINVTLDKQELPSTLYRVSYTTTENLDGNCAGANWSSVKPTDNKDIRGVKITFINGAISNDQGWLVVESPMKSETGLTLEEDNGDSVRDVAGFQWGTNSGTDYAHTQLYVPAPIVDALSVQMTKAGGTIAGVAVPGETVTYKIEPKILNQEITEAKPITITLDPCETNPRLVTNQAYTMSVVEGTATCENPTVGTKTVVTLTPTDSVKLEWNSSGIFTSQSAVSIRTTIDKKVDNTGINGYTVNTTFDYGTASDAVSTQIPQSSERISYVESDPKVVQVDEPLNWTVDVSRRGDSATAESIIILPENGSSVPYDGSDPGNNYNGNKESKFHGTVALSGLELVNASSGTKLYVHTDRNATFDTAGWVEYTDGMDLSPYNSVKVFTPDSAVSTASVKVTMQPTGNQKDDVYLLGLTETPVDEGLTTLPKPWPAEIRVVSSSLSGYVVDDKGEVYSWDTIDVPYSGVTVVLKDSDGNVVDTTTTDQNGYYEFTELRGGTYTVEVDRSSGIPDTVTTVYGTDEDVTNSFSYPTHTKSNASDTASVTVGVGANVTHVDFGYLSPDPRLELDKNTTNVTDNGDGTVTASWEVIIKNTGNFDLNNVKLTDNLPDGAFNVSSDITYEKRPTFLPNNFNQSMYGSVSIISDSNGQVYVWTQTEVTKLDGETTAPFMVTSGGGGAYSLQQGWIDSDGNYKVYDIVTGTVKTIPTPGDFTPGVSGGMLTDKEGAIWTFNSTSESLTKTDLVGVPDKGTDLLMTLANGNVVMYSEIMGISEPMVYDENFKVPSDTFDGKDLMTSGNPLIVDNSGDFWLLGEDATVQGPLSITGIGPVKPGTIITLSDYSIAYIGLSDGNTYKVDFNALSAVVEPDLNLAPGVSAAIGSFATNSNGELVKINASDDFVVVDNDFVTSPEIAFGNFAGAVTDAAGTLWTVDLDTGKLVKYQEGVMSEGGVSGGYPIIIASLMGTGFSYIDKNGEIQLLGSALSPDVNENVSIDGNGMVQVIGNILDDDLYPYQAVLTDSSGEVLIVQNGIVDHTGIMTNYNSTPLYGNTIISDADGKLYVINERSSTGITIEEITIDGTGSFDIPAPTKFGPLGSGGINSLVTDETGQFWVVHEDLNTQPGASYGYKAYELPNYASAPNQIFGNTNNQYTNDFYVIYDINGVPTRISIHYTGVVNTYTLGFSDPSRAGEVVYADYLSDANGNLYSINDMSQVSGVKVAPNLTINLRLSENSAVIIKDVNTGEYKYVANYNTLEDITFPITPTYDWAPISNIYYHTNGQAYYTTAPNYNGGPTMEIIPGVVDTSKAGEYIHVTRPNDGVTNYDPQVIAAFTNANNELVTTNGDVIEYNGTPIIMNTDTAVHFLDSDDQGYLLSVTDADGNLYTITLNEDKSVKTVKNNQIGDLPPSQFLNGVYYISDSSGQLYHGSPYEAFIPWKKVNGEKLAPNQIIEGRQLFVTDSEGSRFMTGYGNSTYSVVTSSETEPITIRNGEPYNIGDLKAGLNPEQVTVNITASFRKGTEEQFLANQAWATSDQAPYEREHGVYNGPNETPDPADGTDINGNYTCTAVGFDGDICDQVPLHIDATQESLGNLSGLAWYDDPTHDGNRTNDEAVRLPGINVTLYKGDVNYGTATTDANGYYEFLGLPGGDNYRVVWDIVGSTFEDRPLALSPQTPASATNNDSNSEGSTGLLTVVPNETLENIDVGAWTPNAHITLTKTFEFDGEQVDFAELPLVNGKTQPVTVNVSFNNDGEEPLERLQLVDDQMGKVLPDFTCAPALANLTLAVGDTVNCSAVLPAMDAGDFHYDNATVTGYGVLTSQEVDSSDDVTILTPQPGPSISVKKYVNDTNWNSGPDNPVSNDATTDTDPSDAQTSDTAVSVIPDGFNTTYVVTNDGNLPANFVTVYDEVAGELVLINGTCPAVTLNPGESMTCYGTQIVTSGGITQTDAVVTAVANVFNSPLVGLTDRDEAFVELQGNAKVTVYYSVDGSECTEANANCIPLEDVPVEIAGNGTETGTDGSVTSDWYNSGDKNISVIIPDWSKIVSTVVNGGEPTTDTNTTVTIVPGETQEVVVTVKLDTTAPESPTPDTPYFESGV